MSSGSERIGDDDERGKKIEIKEEAHVSGSQEGNKTPACAACNVNRRPCTQDCPFAPYFPAHDSQKFEAINEIFGATNFLRIMKEVAESDRDKALKSLVDEANTRLRDPVNGSRGEITYLLQQIKEAEAELEAVTALHKELTEASMIHPYFHGMLRFPATSLDHASSSSTASLPYPDLTPVSLSSFGQQMDSWERIGDDDEIEREEEAHVSGSQEGNRRPACAACNVNRRACTQDCPFAPYFPAHDSQKFEAINEIFGATNFLYLMKEVAESDRDKAFKSLVDEANNRLRDPVKGSTGEITCLLQQIKEAEAEFEAVRELHIELIEVGMLPAPLDNGSSSSTASLPYPVPAPDTLSCFCHPIQQMDSSTTSITDSSDDDTSDSSSI